MDADARATARATSAGDSRAAGAAAGQCFPPQRRDADGLPRLTEIRGAVAARARWAMGALQRLIAIDSVAPHERACQEALADLLRADGFPVLLLPLDTGDLRAADGFVDAGLPLADRPNLVVAWGQARAGSRSLILNSHIDTVSWREEADRWRVHPLSGQVIDGRVYGRGAVDAKGQVIAAALAVVALRDLGYEPPGRLLLQSVVCEEPTGNGTLALCAQGWTADAAVVLEPTGNQVAYGHRGIVGLRFHARGRAAHAAAQGSGARGVNAILAAGRLVGALEGALAGWAAPSDGAYGAPVLNVGRIAGGTDIFTVPDRCTIECGLRYAPGTYEAVVEHVRDHLRGAGFDGGEGWPDWLEMAVFSHYDAAEVAPSSPLPTALLECVREVDPACRLTTMPGGCDARHFVNRYGVPAVVFGPGQLACAHAADEHLVIDQWLEAAAALALFTVRWCS